MLSQLHDFIDFDSYPNWTPADGCSALGGTIYQTHGTHVAGTIAQVRRGRVVAWRRREIGAYKVFDLYLFEGDLYVGAFDGPLFDAIIQATGAGYRVISMSLGSYGVRNDKSLQTRRGCLGSRRQVGETATVLSSSRQRETRRSA